jgi:hypothetical protein
MTPEQRAEHLKHSNDMATINDTIAEEGESHVSLLKFFFLIITFILINRLSIEMNMLIYTLYVLLMLIMNFTNLMVDIHIQ